MILHPSVLTFIGLVVWWCGGIFTSMEDIEEDTIRRILCLLWGI
jgi:hypothetical protein